MYTHASCHLRHDCILACFATFLLFASGTNLFIIDGSFFSIIIRNGELGDSMVFLKGFDDLASMASFDGSSHLLSRLIVGFPTKSEIAIETIHGLPNALHSVKWADISATQHSIASNGNIGFD